MSMIAFLYLNYTTSYSGLLALPKHVLCFSETTMPLLLNWTTEVVVGFDNPLGSIRMLATLPRDF